MDMEWCPVFGPRAYGAAASSAAANVIANLITGVEPPLDATIAAITDTYGSFTYIDIELNKSLGYT